MSIASRARERQAAQRLLERRYGPFPDPGSAPPPLDPEFERLAGWWCQHHRAVAVEMGAEAVVVTDTDDGHGRGKVEVYRQSQRPATMNILPALLVAGFGLGLGLGGPPTERP